MARKGRGWLGAGRVGAATGPQQRWRERQCAREAARYEARKRRTVQR
jgi:hypothetical protein